MTDITDVAREVELSPATVSRALRGMPGVSAVNRIRIAEAAERLGYVPSPSAVRFASGRTRTVGVIVPSATGWYFQELLQGAAETLQQAGYDVLYLYLAEADFRRRVFQTSLLSKRVDALIVLGMLPALGEQAGLVELGKPVAVVGAISSGLYSVTIDDGLAARLATSHLVELGHRRIGYVGGPLAVHDSPDVQNGLAAPARLAGYRTVLRECGVAPDRELEDMDAFTAAGGALAGRRLLGRSDRPTAILAASDEVAIGVLGAAREAGLRVPEDLSVIGIDDHELAEFLGLTTVAQPVRAQGRCGAERVLARLAGVRPPDSETLPVELVVRSSTAPPRRV